MNDVRCTSLKNTQSAGAAREPATQMSTWRKYGRKHRCLDSIAGVRSRRSWSRFDLARHLKGEHVAPKSNTNPASDRRSRREPHGRQRACGPEDRDTRRVTRWGRLRRSALFRWRWWWFWRRPIVGCWRRRDDRRLHTPHGIDGDRHGGCERRHESLTLRDFPIELPNTRVGLTRSQNLRASVHAIANSAQSHRNMVFAILLERLVSETRRYLVSKRFLVRARARRTRRREGEGGGLQVVGGDWLAKKQEPKSRGKAENRATGRRRRHEGSGAHQNISNSRASQWPRRQPSGCSRRGLVEMIRLRRVHHWKSCVAQYVFPSALAAYPQATFVYFELVIAAEPPAHI